MANPDQIKAAWGAMSPQEQESFISSLSDEEASKLSDSLGAQQATPLNEQLKTLGAMARSGQSYPMPGPDPTKVISSIPSSAGNMVVNLASAVAHPIDTLTGLGNLAVGGIDYLAQKAEAAAPESMRNAINTANNFISRNTGMLQEVPQGGIRAMPGFETPRVAASAFGDFYANRYGSNAAFNKTAETDPIGVMADVSALLGIGAGTLKMAGANDAAAAAMKASNATNPINIAAKAVSPVIKNVYSYAVGQTTGSGKRAIDEALKGSKEFTDAMRGGLTDEEVLQNSRDAIQSLKDSRSAAYQAELSNLKNATQIIPIDDVKNMAEGWLKRYGVKQSPTGDLDFSRSTLKDVAANEVKSIYDDISSWGSKAEDLTPLGLDTLKRRIQNNFMQNSQSRAMATAMSNAVKEKIVQNVPSYAKMTADYGKSSETIGMIEKALSTRDPRMADTALRKITVAIRQDSGFRRAMLDTLDQQAGGNIAGQAAGRVMSNAWTTRLNPSLLTGGAGIMAGILHNPLMLALIPMASPRVMGEFSRAAGIAAKLSGKIPKQAMLAAEREQAIQNNQ